MRIHVLSDLHTEFGVFTPPPVDADVVVLAGDIGAVPRGIRRVAQAFRDTPIIYVMGNHEFYGSNMQFVISEMRRTSAPHVHFLDNQSIEISGVRFLGCTLWTDFLLFGRDRQEEVMLTASRGLNDYTNISFRDDSGKRKLTPTNTLALHEQSRAWLETELAKPYLGPTVVVTHHAPHPNSTAPGYEDDPLTAAYVSDLSPLMGKALLWIHGHIHASVNYEVAGTRVLCNPRGYHRFGLNTDFDPGLVVEIGHKVRVLNSAARDAARLLTAQRDALAAQVPVRLIEGKPYYVRDADIPAVYRSEFAAAMDGATGPVFEGEGQCWYVWDWENWLGRRFCDEI